MFSATYTVFSFQHHSIIFNAFQHFLCNICEMGDPFHYIRTHWTQNPVRGDSSVGSTPTSGTPVTSRKSKKNSDYSFSFRFSNRTQT